MHYENKFGPRKKSCISDVFHALYFLRPRRTSREALARELGVNTGSVRSIVQFLKKEKLVKTSKGGMVLAPKGNKMAEAIRQKILGAGKINGAITSRKAGYCLQLKKKIDTRKIIQLRDAGIMKGAGGITILVAKRNKFHAPYLNEKEYANELVKLSKIFDPAGTVIIAFGGENPRRAAWHLAAVIAKLAF